MQIQQTGSTAAQLATFPWFNINTITVSAMQWLQNVGTGSLDLIEPLSRGGQPGQQRLSIGTTDAVSYIIAAARQRRRWSMPTEACDSPKARTFPLAMARAALAAATFAFFFSVLPSDQP